jgi:uncharacterized protein YwgA
MNTQEPRADLRLATISALVKQAAPHSLGRTAVMKLVYFLQVLHKMPLGYDFRIYTYGPYDSQVLEDLKVAELKGAVKSAAVGYAVGTGYSITPGSEADAVVARSPSISEFLPKIAAVVDEFGNRSATDLEMASTLVFVDRTEMSSGRTITIADAVQKVKEMKPRLEPVRISQEATSLKGKGYIAAA